MAQDSIIYYQADFINSCDTLIMDMSDTASKMDQEIVVLKKKVKRNRRIALGVGGLAIIEAFLIWISLK